MFVVLKTVKSEKGFFKRRKQFRKLKEAPALVCKTDKGLPFYIVEVFEGKKGIDWNLAADKCGRFASRTVASHSIPLPDNSGLKRFIPISMNAILTFNTAIKTLTKSDLPADKICITVTDRNAFINSRICELLPFASAVKVVTAYPERFAAAAEDAYKNHGASLIIRNIYEPAKQPEIVICCDGAVLSSMNEAAVFVSRRKRGGKILFSGSGVVLSDYHRSILPDDIETVDFAGALTELCSSSEYRHSSFAEIEISCDKCEDKSPEKCLECFICNKAVT